MHNTMIAMAWLAKKRIVKDWAIYTGLALTASKWFYALGSDIGGMIIKVTGCCLDGKAKSVTWALVAKNGVGPYRPPLPVILVTRKIIANQIPARGAQASLGLFTIEEFMGIAKDWGIYQRI